MAHRLNPLQRAYLMGYRRAKAQMRREVDEVVGELLAMCDRVKVERDALRADMRDMVQS